MVWSDPGGTTHNFAIGHRSQLLPFTVASTADGGRTGVLTVSAPAEPNHAPPGFYLVFLLSGDLYSEGTWVQIREAAPKPLAGVVAPGAAFVAGLSSSFEPAGPGAAAFAAAGGGGVTANVTADAAGAGGAGLRIALAAPGKAPAPARVASGGAKLEGGKWCTLMLWARASAPGQAFQVSVAREGGGGGDAPLPPATVRPQPGAHCQYTLPAFKPAATGSYQIVITADLTPAAPALDIDDVEVYCA